MCYDLKSATKAKLKYALHRGDDPEYIADLERQLQLYETFSYYHVSGFAHPRLMVFTNDKPYTAQWFTWGLIPAWVKDSRTAATMMKQTLNARGETIFEKPAFRNAAKNRRCLVYIDAFYEHHHLHGKTIPFHIAMKDDSPMVVAGLWEEWTDKTTGEIHHTVSLVTTEANSLMESIHNNPKASGPRMPLLFTKDQQDEWLRPCKTELDKKTLVDLIKPMAPELLHAYTVGKLKGKAAIGNVADIEKPVAYEGFYLN